MSDFFEALDAIEGDAELVETAAERDAFATEFEGELVKQWSKATDGKQTAVDQPTEVSAQSRSHEQDVQVLEHPPTVRQESRRRTRKGVSDRKLSRLAPNLIPTAPTLIGIVNDSPSSTSTPSSPIEDSPPGADMSKKPTLDLRSFRQNSGPSETTDQKRYREEYEKLVKQIEKAMGKEEKAVKEGLPPAMRPANPFRVTSDLLEGLRFVVVWSPRGWRLVHGILEKIHVNGGKFCMKYEKGVTHLLCSDDMSEGDFLKHSGFVKVEDIPEGVTSLHVKWLHDSLTYKSLRPVAQYRFPKQKSVDVPAKRKAAEKSRPPPSKQIRYEPTDSETPESNRPPPPGLTLVPQRGRLERREEEAESSASSPSSHAAGLDQITEDIEEANVGPAENAEEPEKRFWLPPGVKADPLDFVISGIKSGTIVEEEDEPTDQPEAPALSKPEAPDWGRFKCQQANPGPRKSINEDLAVGMEELAKRYEHAPDKNPFSKMAYQKAASILRNLTYRIETKEQAQAVRGIGSGLADRVGEILTLGRSLRAQYEDTPQARTLTTFGKIYGVGPSRASDLWSAGARTRVQLRLDDLRQPGNPYNLTEHQLLGLEYYDDLNTRMPRSEVQALFDIIAGEAHKIDPKVQIEAMGSFRRGEETSGDLDCLITRDTSDGKNHSGVVGKLVDRLSTMGIITHHLSQPSDYRAMECKWMGCGKLTPESKLRRIDILTIPFEQHGAALIYFTGNDIFNRSLRLYARKQGYSLNQRGLYKNVVRDPKTNLKTTQGVLVASRTEQEIFDVLNIRWREPRLRRP